MEKIIIKEQDIRGKYEDYHLTRYKVDKYEVCTRKFDTYADIEVHKKLGSNPERNTIEYYLPEIFVELFDINGENNPSFEIQTTSYGSLRQDKFEVYIEALKKGKEVADLVMSEIMIPLSEEYRSKSE